MLTCVSVSDTFTPSTNEVIMLIKMLSTRYGCENGRTVHLYKRNEQYSMADSLACYFIQQGFAKEIRGRL